MDAALCRRVVEGTKVFLQAPGDPSVTWVMWKRPEEKIPCFWLLARKLAGRVCTCAWFPRALDRAGLIRG